MKRLVAFLWAVAIVVCGARAALAVTPTVTLAEGKAYLSDRVTWSANASPQVEPSDVGAIPSAGERGTGRRNVTPAGSLAVTTNMSWIGRAVDYTATPANPGAAPREGALPSLELRRYHNDRAASSPSSLGPGVFSNYDITLSLYRTNLLTGAGSMVLLDPRDLAPRNLSDPSSCGLYLDSDQNSIDGVRLYNAASQPVVNQAAAVTAVLTTRDGWKYTFEILRTETSLLTANRFGRLVRQADRNNNAIVIAYQHPASASDAALGNDRSKLWKIATITDALGRAANFTYSIKVAGRWAVDTVTLPNGQQVHYTYNDGGIVGLSGVSHPDGSASTFSATQDAETQTRVLHIDDPAAEGTDQRRDVYLTNAIWVEPLLHLPLSQPANLTRMIVNGQGEVVYLNRSSHNLLTGKNTYYVYEGGSSFFRYTTDLSGAPVRMDQALSWDITCDPASYSYQRVETYDTVNRRVVSTEDILGRVTEYDRDAVTGAVKKTTYPDGSTATTTYNAFRQPLLVTDRIGRKTQHTYDAQGNLLSKTVAVGTPAQATWSSTYNARGQRVTATDANGHVTAYAYTAAGLLASVTEPPDSPGGPQAVTTYAYDGSGRLTAVTDPRGRLTTYQYDARNRVTANAHHDGTTETFTYGTGANANRLVQKTDRLGTVTAYAYDTSGHEILRTDAAGKPEAVSRACSYLPGTALVQDCMDRGERTIYAYDDHNRRVATTLQPNAATLLADGAAYDAPGRVTFTTDPYGRKTFYVYDANDRAIRTVEEMVPGTVTPPAWSGDPDNDDENDCHGGPDTSLSDLPRVLTADAPYLVTETAYDAEGQVLSRTDGRGIATTLAYDGQGRLVQQIQAAGTSEQAKTEYVYDPQGNRIQERHPRHFTEPGGFLTTSTFTGRNLLASVTEAAGRPEQATESYGYDLDGQRSLRVDGRGHVWSTVWSQSRRDHQAEIAPPADLDGDPINPDTAAIEAGVHDSLGRLTHAFVASDAAVFSSDAAFGDPTATLREVTTRYDGLDRPIAQTTWLVELGAVDENDPPIAGDAGFPASMGLTTQWVYDDDLTDGAGLDAAYGAYLTGLGLGAGSDGSAVETTSPAGDKTVTIDDGAEREVRTVRVHGGVATSVVTDTVYDLLVSGTPGIPGPLVETQSIAYPSGLGGTAIVTASRADGDGREVASLDGEGQMTRRSHDASGNVTSTRDPNGVGEDCLFDARNREVACTDTQGDTRQTAYDAGDHRIASIDGLGRTTAHVYDARDRIVAKIDRLSGITASHYDQNNNLVQLTDAELRATSYVFDARDTLIQETFPDSGVRTYAHDAAGRMIARLNQALDRTVYGYDRADRLVTQAYPDGLDDTFAYDGASRLTAATSARYDNTVTLAYDAAGRQVTETLTVLGQSYTTGYGYDAADRKTAIAYPDGSVVDQTFTARDKLDTIDYNGSPVVHRAYDPGMRLTTTTYGNGTVETRTYRADDLEHTISVPGVTGFSYSYDADKNPLAQDNSVDPEDGQTYGYDSENQLTSFGRANGDAQSWSLSLEGDWNQLTSNGVTESRAHDAAHALVERDGEPLLHDAKGNLVEDDQGNPYAWDFENRMGSVDGGKVTYGYGYDALGRRVSESASNGKGPGGTTDTAFVYDGWRAIAEYEGAAPASDSIQKYVLGDELDEVLMMDAGDRYYAHANRMLSVQALTDETGALVEASRYDPYGTATVLTGAGVDGVWFTEDDYTDAASFVRMPFGFTGQRFDEGTGLSYYKNRYYSAELGRFVSRDPIGYEGGSANLYQYVGSSPVTWSDPLGLKLDNSPNCEKEKGVGSAMKMKKSIDAYIAAICKAPGVHSDKGKKVYACVERHIGQIKSFLGTGFDKDVENGLKKGEEIKTKMFVSGHSCHKNICGKACGDAINKEFKGMKDGIMKKASKLMGKVNKQSDFKVLCTAVKDLFACLDPLMQ